VEAGKWSEAPRFTILGSHQDEPFRVSGSISMPPIFFRQLQTSVSGWKTTMIGRQSCSSDFTGPIPERVA
jgi:hypothetical protein